jgi:hypothetical protein
MKLGNILNKSIDDRLHDALRETKDQTRVVIAAIVGLLLIALGTSNVMAKKPSKSKFYDFSDTLIDGEIKKPTALYTDIRQQVKFERLLKIRKSFLRNLFDTAKERVFK